MTTAIYRGLLNAVIAVISGIYKLGHVSVFLQAMRELFLLLFLIRLNELALVMSFSH